MGTVFSAGPAGSCSTYRPKGTNGTTDEACVTDCGLLLDACLPHVSTPGGACFFDLIAKDAWGRSRLSTSFSVAPAICMCCLLC